MGVRNLVQPDIVIEPVEETVAEEELESLWKVIVHNDDFTPYDFVIIILIRFFKLSTPDAESITWKAHHSGAALVQILPKSEAERRVGQAHFAASLEGYPLTFTIEPEE
jgi:ATP-dependent Clp protease adaptor protein ClpS